MSEDKKMLADDARGEELADDDFADDEGWDEDAYEGDALPEEDEGAAKPARKKSKSNLFIILGGVAVALVVLYVKLGSAPPAQQTAVSPPPAMEQQASSSAPQPADAAVPPPLPPGGQQPQQGQVPDNRFGAGFLKNPESFQEVEKIRENMQFEDYVEGDTEIVPQNNAPSPDRAAGLQEPLTPLPPGMENSPVSSPAPAASEAHQEPRPDMEALNARLADLSSRMDQIETALEALAVPSINPQDVANLHTAVDRLSGRIEDLEKKPAPQQPAATQSVARRAESGETPKKKRLPVPSWVLKSAQPGRAIVSRTGESEVYSVAVGDSLEGIGRINSVTLENGRWIVHGTKGTIAQ